MIFSSLLAILITGFTTPEAGGFTFLFPWDSSKGYNPIVPWQVGLIGSVWYHYDCFHLESKKRPIHDWG